MFQWLTNIFSNGAGTLVKSISDVADEFITTDEEKQAFALEVEKVLQKRDSEIEQTIRSELDAKSRIIEAEMRQDDNYTKRARPTVVYFGLVVIFLNHVLFPNLAQFTELSYKSVDLPSEFWLAWGGICTAWVIGRSAEKRGSRSPAVAAITGNKVLSSYGN